MTHVLKGLNPIMPRKTKTKLYGVLVYMFWAHLAIFKEENGKYPTCIGAVSFTTSYIFLVLDFLAISTRVLEPSEISSK